MSLLCSSTGAVHGVSAEFFWAVYTGTRPGVAPAIRAGKGWRGRRELAPRCSATQLGASWARPWPDTARSSSSEPHTPHTPHTTHHTPHTTHHTPHTNHTPHTTHHTPHTTHHTPHTTHHTPHTTHHTPHTTHHTPHHTTPHTPPHTTPPHAPFSSPPSPTTTTFRSHLGSRRHRCPGVAFFDPFDLSGLSRHTCVSIYSLFPRDPSMPSLMRSLNSSHVVGTVSDAHGDPMRLVDVPFVPAVSPLMQPDIGGSSKDGRLCCFIVMTAIVAALLCRDYGSGSAPLGFYPPRLQDLLAAATRYGQLQKSLLLFLCCFQGS